MANTSIEISKYEPCAEVLTDYGKALIVSNNSSHFLVVRQPFIDQSLKQPMDLAPRGTIVDSFNYSGSAPSATRDAFKAAMECLTFIAIMDTEWN
jgi:hypothetical protein